MSETIIRTFSGNQLVELKKLFANHEINHLGIVDGDGRIIVEYQEVAWRTAFKGDLPVITLKTVTIPR
jgi:hypothetical protein